MNRPDSDPQAATERRSAARVLLAAPLTCREHDPASFALIRRHEAELDRAFTQRLGYRLDVDADTARLYKSGVASARPLRTASGRALYQLELAVLVLVLATTVAGPAVISLRDLVDAIRSSAVDAGVELPSDLSGRRALVTALRWMIDHGLAVELHDHVDAYARDEGADAVLRLRPDRIASLALPALSAPDAASLLAAADRRGATRQWLRARLVEEPVLYRDDLTEAEWSELRRRLGDEARYLEETFGLLLEARAEGVAAIDPSGDLADTRFPAGGTEGHAALLLIAVMRARAGGWWDPAEIDAVIGRLAGTHARHWAKDLVGAPDRLARRAVDLLVGMRLAEHRDNPPGVRLLPAAARFAPAAAQDTLL
ncbi:TIGR02678 family protein [Acidiferrimicrobium sp. IK]|uniref:TIGR02678 family protein n=1 Tax=Acidiferrimicrobium sp. IK TaxID=2871700 RepID=UPI0021CB4F76|nr:TIGR02678 family protein [Acidiferrimicrobium sp. IK]MCU4186561.1 TIGR02678 family protein [Acidiferrimicrobium sp. IK]